MKRVRLKRNNFPQITQLINGVQIQGLLQVNQFPSSCCFSCSRRVKIAGKLQATAGTTEAQFNPIYSVGFSVSEDP